MPETSIYKIDLKTKNPPYGELLVLGARSGLSHLITLPRQLLYFRENFSERFPARLIDLPVDLSIDQIYHAADGLGVVTGCVGHEQFEKADKSFQLFLRHAYHAPFCLQIFKP
jgi:hypothetical protein